MKYLNNLLFALLFPIFVAAQTSEGVIGRLTDADSGVALGYATVVAENAKGKMVGSCIAKPTGEFFLQLTSKGDYTLHFTIVGYKNTSKKISFADKSIDVGTISLRAGVEIDQINVAAKPLLKREADRIVYDVRNDPDANKMKMMGIMDKIPKLTMNPGTGNLIFEGAPITKILFDGKETDMISVLRQYPMEFIKANVMGTIELILPGSAEYNNTTPILNITLDRPLPNGIAGQISPTISSNGKYATAIDLVTKMRLVGIGFNYGVDYSDSPKLRTESSRESLLDDSPSHITNNNSQSWSSGTNHNFGLSLFRPILNDKINISISANSSINQGDSYTNSLSRSFDNSGNETANTSTTSKGHTSSPMRLNGGVIITQKFGQKSNHFYILKYAYSDNSSNGQQTTSTTSTISSSPSTGRQSLTSTGSTSHIVNFMMSNRSPDRKAPGMLNTKINYISRDYNNSTDYYSYDHMSDEYIKEEERFNGLEYRQQIANMHIGYNNQLFNKKLRYNFSLNAENVSNKGTYLSTGGTKLDYNEFNLLPSISTNYGFKRLKLRGAYNTRVLRPNISMLNPFIDDSNPDNIRVGNPTLKGEYAHRLNFHSSYDLNKQRSTSLSLSYKVEFVGNGIDRITSINSDNIATTTYANLSKSIKQDAGLSLYFSIVKSLSTSYSFGYTRDKYTLSSTDNIVEGITGSASLSWEPKGVRFINISYYISPSSYSAQSSKQSYVSTVDITINKYFKKLHFGGYITVNDLLHGHKMIRETISSTQFIQKSQRERMGRTVKLSLYWRFGRFKDSDVATGITGDTYDTSR